MGLQEKEEVEDVMRYFVVLLLALFATFAVTNNPAQYAVAGIGVLTWLCIEIRRYDT